MQPLPDDRFLAEQRRRDPVAASRETRLALAAVCGLAENSRTRREPIRVSVQNDVVVLAGAVRSWSVRATAGAVARSVPGAHDVCNSLVPSSANRALEADSFESIVAGLRAECCADPHNRRPGRQPVGPVAFTVLLGLWLTVPVTTVALGVPSEMALLITIFGTATVLPLRSRRRWLSRKRH